jgi:PPOX class probable F420-dependent enzyme
MAELTDNVRALFEGANFVHVATVGPSGAPHSVPVWADVEGDRIAFFTQLGSRKARNVAADPRVAFSVVDHERPYRMAQVRGRVVETLEGEEALAVADRMALRYTGNPFPLRSGVAFLVEPAQVFEFQLPFEHAPAA